MIIKADSALLIGNGINRVTGCGDSWSDLLIKLFHEELQNLKLSDKQIEEIINNRNELSYPEVFDTIFNYKALDNKVDELIISDRTAIKEQFVSYILDNKQNENEKLSIHTQILKFAKKNNIPILTTNFDNNFILADEDLKNCTYLDKNNKFKPIFSNFYSEKKRVIDYYPFDCFYSNSVSKKINDNLHTFGIWHIHGYPFYKRSIVIGDKDYRNSINMYKKYIYKDSKFLSLDINKKYKFNESWKGRDTWLNIFLNIPTLYIIGLGLESSESSLRWLLKTRYSFIQKTNRFFFKTIFKAKNNDISEAKRFYLKSIGVEIEDDINTYEELYNLKIEK